MKLPRDIEILQAQEDSPFDTLGYRWVEPGHVPYGYDEAAGVPPDVAAAWQRMFQELIFIAETDDGESLALWKYRDNLPLENAPLVLLDTEGQLRSKTLSLADQLLVGLQPTEFAGVREQLVEVGLAPSANVTAIHSAVRFLPDPQTRFESIANGNSSITPARNVEPKELLDLLGMNGQDPRVAAYLATIENPNQPIELKCDGEGLMQTIFLSPENLKTKVVVKGISLGEPVASLTVLGPPEKETPHWRRWITNGQVIHAELKEDRIARITVWAVLS
jgi:hypothetical protein